MKNPFSKNNYDYLNELLDLKPYNEKDPNSKNTNYLSKESTTISPEIFESIKAKITEEEAKLKASSAENKASIEANLLKMKRAYETLQDNDKRKLYDEALKKAPKMELKLAKGVSLPLALLVPISNIMNEFEAFKKEKCKNNPSFGEGGNFTYKKIEGPPVIHCFTFPDQKSMDDFIEKLFSKNMAMLPNGSQSIDDLKKEQQKVLK